MLRPRLALRYRMSRKRLLRHLLKRLEPAAAGSGGEAVGTDVGGSGRREGEELAAASTTTTADASAADLSTSSAAAEAELSVVLDRFNQWFAAQGPPTSKIAAAVIPEFRLGVVATDNIAAEELYLAVPSRVIMSLGTAAKCPDLGAVFAVRPGALRL